MLPFTLPDEPLYLIYTINRVVQVRAGTLESNMKDFLHSVQGNDHKGNDNGMVQSDEAFNPDSNRSMTVDGVSGQLHGQHLYGDDAHNDSNMKPMTSRHPYSISASDLQKIQVHLVFMFNYTSIGGPSRS